MLPTSTSTSPGWSVGGLTCSSGSSLFCWPGLGHLRVATPRRSLRGLLPAGNAGYVTFSFVLRPLVIVLFSFTRTRPGPARPEPDGSGPRRPNDTRWKSNALGLGVSQFAVGTGAPMGQGLNLVPAPPDFVWKDFTEPRQQTFRCRAKWHDIFFRRRLYFASSSVSWWSQQLIFGQ